MNWQQKTINRPRASRDQSIFDVWKNLVILNVRLCIRNRATREALGTAANLSNDLRTFLGIWGQPTSDMAFML